MFSPTSSWIWQLYKQTLQYYNILSSYNSYEMKIISLFGLSSAEHQCPGQCPWDPGTHRISWLVDLFRWWETSRNSIGCHLDGRAHSRVYKRPGILFSRKDTGFLRMYKLGSHFFRSRRISQTSRNLDWSCLQVWHASELQKSHLHLPPALVLGIGCKESLIFWKAGPRTSQLVHWESSTAGCNLRRRPGSPPGWRGPCSSGGRRRRSSSSRCPQWRSRRKFCHLQHRMKNIEWTYPPALANWSHQTWEFSLPVLAVVLPDIPVLPWHVSI